MSHYLDIDIRPDPELTSQHLLNGLYARLHRALVQLGSQDIGVSFPEHDDARPTLGNKLRLHGPETSLQALVATSWLKGMLDHVKVLAIKPVPAGTSHRHVSRVQAKSSPSRLRRRAMRRHGLDAETAMKRIPDSVAEHLRLPFVVLGSRSTGQASFPLFIRHGPLLAEPMSGTFNSYGLGQGATIPWF
ncbi:type I-F CRISPR-associated endoribonuclease Cas6/Csy4 [Marilutibacter chinensis]|uniref:Type I-F CRISPR-associated endoribonuclease Cas6/Csy4 n=1 Tax=Marilutibacter chinensis TaxID=2912247 RepID=A0ABS9HXE5_9GAMM|nr:type I-F CRISPR-associated endoribonuclease Cas6/Csy4 [Lysobacter chinensis]MCF7223559.1 type I-F CRISPR-associated endoribonuclease Cas6/Csy4 [Lysobacter chinensis]